MQTTLRLNDQVYRDAKAEAARLGVTLTRFIEDALHDRIRQVRNGLNGADDPVTVRNRIMEEPVAGHRAFSRGPATRSRRDE